MEYCVNCGAPLPEGRLRCPRCGAQQPAPGQWEAPPSYAAPEPEPDYAPQDWDAPEPDPREAPLSVWGYLWSGFLLHIPLLGLLVQIIWTLGGAKNRCRRNYAAASLIWSCLGLILLIYLLVQFYIHIYPHMDEIIAYIDQMSALSSPL